MRLAVVTMLCLALSASAFANKNEEAIRKQLETFATAWNSHDAKAMAAVWSEDGTLVNPAGRWAKGRTEIEKLFTDEHTTFLKTSTYTWTNTTFRWVKPDVAFVDGVASLTGAKTPDGKDMPGTTHVSLVFVKKAGKWWSTDVRAFHYVTPPPSAETARK